MYLRIKSLDHPVFATVERLRVEFTYLTPEYPIDVQQKWFAVQWIVLGDSSFEELGISKSMSLYSHHKQADKKHSFIGGVGGAHQYGGRNNTISTVFHIKEVHCKAGLVLKDKIDITNYLFPYSEDVYEEGMAKYDMRRKKFYELRSKGVPYTLGPCPISVD